MWKRSVGQMNTLITLVDTNQNFFLPRCSNTFERQYMNVSI